MRGKPCTLSVVPIFPEDEKIKLSVTKLKLSIREGLKNLPELLKVYYKEMLKVTQNENLVDLYDAIQEEINDIEEKENESDEERGE